jgi:hypothetical protein
MTFLPSTECRRLLQPRGSAARLIYKPTYTHLDKRLIRTEGKGPTRALPLQTGAPWRQMFNLAEIKLDCYYSNGNMYH